MPTSKRQAWRRARPSVAVVRIGPEILTAASDNDPTNIGTAALVGAQTGYQLSWVALLTAPMLAVVLTIAGQVGAVARSDLQSLVLKRYGRHVALALLLSMVIVNLVTIAADIQAGAAGIGILTGIGYRWLVLPLGLVLVGLLLVGKYDEVVRVLRYLLLGFLAFGAAAILAHPDWALVFKGSFIPILELRPSELAGALALLGTTLTAYVYHWETISRGVEESPDNDAEIGRGLAAARLGSVAGSVATALILWLMLLTFAATLGRSHRTVATAQDAAYALRPLAGSLAANMFAVGLIVSTVVALPILMASTAYVVGAQFDWRRGLSQKVRHARAFYAMLTASIALGVALALAGIQLVDLLVVASVIGGLGTPVGLVLLVRLGRDPEVMGSRPISSRLAFAGWAVAIGVGGLAMLYIILATLGMF